MSRSRARWGVTSASGVSEGRTHLWTNGRWSNGRAERAKQIDWANPAASSACSSARARHRARPRARAWPSPRAEPASPPTSAVKALEARRTYDEAHDGRSADRAGCRSDRARSRTSALARRCRDALRQRIRSIDGVSWVVRFDATVTRWPQRRSRCADPTPGSSRATRSARSQASECARVMRNRCGARRDATGRAAACRPRGLPNAR